MAHPFLPALAGEGRLGEGRLLQLVLGGLETELRSQCVGGVTSITLRPIAIRRRVQYTRLGEAPHPLARITSAGARISVK